MLVATPGQTTAYILHNNNNNSSGNTTTTANIPTASAVTSATAAASSSSSSIVTTKKQQAVFNSSSSSKETPNCVKNNNNTSSTTKSTQPTKTANSTTDHQNHFNFHVPSNKRDPNNIARNSLITTSSSSKNSNNQQQQHSLNNSGVISRPPSFLSALKDTVQKALVTTASSLSRNGGNRTTAASALTSSNTTSSSNNTSSTFLHGTSSALSLATTKTSSTTITNPAASASSSASSSTILPLTIARKKFAQAIATQPKLHTIPPTILHRNPEERQKASSTDSLQKEMCHFKPIRTVPTTPWKSGSKSRGSSLRFPKANLATTKTEFILKSNCDVNNRKRKQQQAQLKQNDQEVMSNDAEGNGDNNDEQENKAYYDIYKPKPSSLHLSASFLTQTHQSAFVCLVANLMNIQSTKSVATSSSPKVRGGMGSQKSKSSRILERSKGSGTATTKVASPTVPVKELFVRHKKFKSPLPPPPIPAKRAKLSTPATRSQRSFGQAALLTKITPSRRKLKGAKSNIINIVKDKSLVSPVIYAGEKNSKVTGQRNSRKRKGTPEDSEPRASTFIPLRGSLQSVSPTPTSRSSTVRARRSVRLMSETCSSNNYFKYPESRLSRAKLQVPSQRHEVCFSPPLTRSRLKKLLSEQKSQKGTTAAATSLIDVKKRKESLRQTMKSAMSSLQAAV